MPPDTEPQIIRLPWNRTALGWLMPLMAVGCVMFARGAVDAPFLASLHWRGRSLFFANDSFTYHGVNVASAAVALFTFYSMGQMAWRWSDEVALGLVGDRLIAHRSLRWPPIALGEIQDIYVNTYRGPALILRLADGKVRRLRGIDGARAEAFVAAVRARLGQSPACATRRSG